MIVFKLSPELGDGSVAEYCTDAETVLARVKAWLDEFGSYPGEFSVESIEMTRAELAAIPEV